MRLSHAQKLYGTTQLPERLKHIAVGPLSLSLDGGNIRYIGFNGVEVLRAVSFLVRDPKWGTYGLELKRLKIKHSAKTFSIFYHGICAGEEGRFEFDARIEGHSTGRLVFSAKGSSDKDFPTNRVGFVVLHPLEGFVGKRIVLEHTDGQITNLKIPREISADQPAFNLRAITHRPVPGLKIRVEMLGDAYEMEDQRNWGDASFKTYVRPLSKPRPFVIAAHEIVEQSVAIELSGHAKRVKFEKRKGGLEIKLLNTKFPKLSLGLDPEDAEATQQNAAQLLELCVRDVVVRFDTRIHAAARMRNIATCLATFGVQTHFEIIVPGLNPTQELLKFKAALKVHKIDPASIVVSPQRDLKTRPSRHLPKGETSQADIAKIAHAHFPDALIGGGTFALFTEFNRNPPSSDGIDFITHATCGIVHAADDVSVMETLSSLGDIARSVRKLVPDKPYRISPSAIGMRHNPYGVATASNPQRQRLTLSRVDPRQSGLFAAAWAVGYLAAMIRNKVEMAGIAHGIGDFGVIEASGALRPIYHVLRGAALGAGKRALAFSSLSSLTAAFGYQDGASRILWVANLTEQPQTFALKEYGKISELNAKTFTKAAGYAAFMDIVTSTANSITLSAYAVARIVL